MKYKAIVMSEKAADQASKACDFAVRQSELVKELKKESGRPTAQIDLAIEWLGWVASMIRNADTIEPGESVYIDEALGVTSR